MATFAEVLAYTMFAQGGRRLPITGLLGSPAPAPQVSTKRVDDSAARTQPVWHFDHDAASTPATITNLTCVSRGMGNGRMTVATAITLESAGIKTAQGVVIDLPLTPDFVIQKAYFKRSSLPPAGHFLYPLQAELDASLGVTFGYEFRDGPSAKPIKIPEAAQESTEFMPRVGSSTSAPPSVGPGQRAKVVVAPLRVIVCLSFVTAKERADFEPGGLLGAGRVWPHVMIMANRDLAEANSVVHVKRPTNLTMAGGDHSKHADMNDAIEAAFFSDNNTEVNLLGNPSPFWDDLFSAYDVGVASGTIRAVDPLEKGGRITGATNLLNSDGITYRPGVITRVKGQGAYDNVHVAPTMRSSATPASPPDYKLKRIYMAPFCEHDCLHIHWRWAVTNKLKQVFGWTKTGPDPRIPGEPYKAAGTPMVPANQVVDIESTSLHSYRYRAKAVGVDGIQASPPIPAGTFSVFFHHGMAYAIALDSSLIDVLDGVIDLTAIKKGEPDLGFGVTAALSAPIRYWRLRFGGDDNTFGPDVVSERLLVPDRSKVLARTGP